MHNNRQQWKNAEKNNVNKWNAYKHLVFDVVAAIVTVILLMRITQTTLNKLIWKVITEL